MFTITVVESQFLEQHLTQSSNNRFLGSSDMHRILLTKIPKKWTPTRSGDLAVIKANEDFSPVSESHPKEVTFFSANEMMWPTVEWQCRHVEAITSRRNIS
jgi:hypothetical protein